VDAEFYTWNLSKEEFENLRGMARTMHDDRLAAMYVSTEGGEALHNVSEERARTIVGLAEARLGMEESRDWQAIDLNAGSIMRWFLDATNDPEKRNLIFGQKSFDKLAELGHMRDWMTWLKEQFDQAETGGRVHLQRELARVAPDGSGSAKTSGRSPFVFIRRRSRSATAQSNHGTNGRPGSSYPQFTTTNRLLRSNSLWVTSSRCSR
jgi:hypothetical protein